MIGNASNHQYHTDKGLFAGLAWPAAAVITGSAVTAAMIAASWRLIAQPFAEATIIVTWTAVVVIILGAALGAVHAVLLTWHHHADRIAARASLPALADQVRGVTAEPVPVLPQPQLNIVLPADINTAAIAEIMRQMPVNYSVPQAGGGAQAAYQDQVDSQVTF